MPDFALSRQAHYTIDIDAYFIGSTVLSVFLWRFLFAGAFNFEAGYVIVLANSLLLFVRGAMTVHRNHLLFLSGTALVSATAALSMHNPLTGTIAQLFGISLFSIYHYSVLTQVRYSLKEIMEIYVRFALATASIGFIPWIYEIGTGNSLYRFCSIFYEPSHYVFATLPALSYCVLRWQSDGSLKFQAILFLLTYILADSAIGFIGIIGTLLFMANLRSAKRAIFAITLTIMACASAYTLSANVKLRVDDTVASQITTEVAETANTPLDERAQGLEKENASTFALLSNAYVAWQAFKASPLIGNGLGTHTTSYEKYGADIMSPRFFLWGLNRDDANSLFLRLLSETGLIGLTTTFCLIFYFYRVEGVFAKLLRNAILPYFVVRLMRFGAYFSLENFFFATLYALNYLQNKAHKFPETTSPPRPTTD